MKTFLIFLVGVCLFAYVYAITGGQDTTIEAYPYVVRLSNSISSCMGFIVSNKIVVTGISCTRQCIVNYTVPCVCKVYAGSTYYSQGVPFEISYAVENENFSYATLENNVALVQIRGQFVYSSTVQPIPYPIIDIAEGTTVYVVGWGVNKLLTTSYPEILQSAELKVMNHADCKQAYAPIFSVSDDMTCAIAPDKDACFGDHGGPVIFKNSTNHISVGILSFAEKPCTYATKYPVISTNMSSVRSWITNKIAELALCTTCNQYCPLPALPTL